MVRLFSVLIGSLLGPRIWIMAMLVLPLSQVLQIASITPAYAQTAAIACVNLSISASTTDAIATFQGTDQYTFVEGDTLMINANGPANVRVRIFLNGNVVSDQTIGGGGVSSDSFTFTAAETGQFIIEITDNVTNQLVSVSIACAPADTGDTGDTGNTGGTSGQDAGALVDGTIPVSNPEIIDGDVLGKYLGRKFVLPGSLPDFARFPEEVEEQIGTPDRQAREEREQPQQGGTNISATQIPTEEDDRSTRTQDEQGFVESDECAKCRRELAQLKEELLSKVSDAFLAAEALSQASESGALDIPTIFSNTPQDRLFNPEVKLSVDDIRNIALELDIPPSAINEALEQSEPQVAGTIAQVKQNLPVQKAQAEKLFSEAQKELAAVSKIIEGTRSSSGSGHDELVLSRDLINKIEREGVRFNGDGDADYVLFSGVQEQIDAFRATSSENPNSTLTIKANPRSLFGTAQSRRDAIEDFLRKTVQDKIDFAEEILAEAASEEEAIPNTLALLFREKIKELRHRQLEKTSSFSIHFKRLEEFEELQKKIALKEDMLAKKCPPESAFLNNTKPSSKQTFAAAAGTEHKQVFGIKDGAIQSQRRQHILAYTPAAENKKPSRAIDNITQPSARQGFALRGGGRHLNAKFDLREWRKARAERDATYASRLNAAHTTGVADSLLDDPKFNLFASASVSFGENNANGVGQESDAYSVSGGLSYLIKPNLNVGLAGRFGKAEIDSNVSDIDTTTWGIAVFAQTQLDLAEQKLNLEAIAAWSRSDIDSIFNNAGVITTADALTTAFSAQIKASTQFEINNLSFTPNASITYVETDRDAFALSDGQIAPGQGDDIWIYSLGTSVGFESFEFADLTISPGFGFGLAGRLADDVSNINLSTSASLGIRNKDGMNGSLSVGYAGFNGDTSNLTFSGNLSIPLN